MRNWYLGNYKQEGEKSLPVLTKKKKKKKKKKKEKKRKKKKKKRRKPICWAQVDPLLCTEVLKKL